MSIYHQSTTRSWKVIPLYLIKTTYDLTLNSIRTKISQFKNEKSFLSTTKLFLNIGAHT